jgi:hypothetical protein
MMRIETKRTLGLYRNCATRQVGGRAWTGSLEGVAIYSRFVGAEEAERKYELWKQR